MMQTPDYSQFVDVGNPNAKPMPNLSPRWWKRTPPPWLRHFVHWRVLDWIDKRFPTCWTMMVLWKMFGANESWWPRAMCFGDEVTHYDYCGKFQDPIE